ncbi:hypothetical protein Tco_0977435 [Tanacetum coccineum]|uniref:Uncharacterized protein n=1 Tax=Tanacetum coccineum TaxID=301880 RepID=A0ABQ5EKJ5_9ASTR
MAVWETMVAVPRGVANFIIPWIVGRYGPELLQAGSSQDNVENSDTVVCVFVSLALMEGWSILKQCSYMISMDAPSSTCIRQTKYPSISASKIMASSERSRARTDGNVMDGRGLGKGDAAPRMVHDALVTERWVCDLAYDGYFRMDPADDHAFVATDLALPSFRILLLAARYPERPLLTRHNRPLF